MLRAKDVVGFMVCKCINIGQTEQEVFVYNYAPVFIPTPARLH